VWEREFNAMGVSTLALDGFTGRGLTQVNTDQALLGRLNFILDIYRSLEILAKHPRVDDQRIALMGFSRGGQAVLYASLARFNKMWNRSGVEFAAYIPFYPDCATTYLSGTDVADRPIQIFGGTPDDYNPIVLCKAYAERLKEVGRDVEVTAYPNAPHAFDIPLLPPTVVVSGGQTVRLRCPRVSSLAGIRYSRAFLTRFNSRSIMPVSGGLRSSSAELIANTTALIRSNSGEGL
jgi:dienelactone hydrolase